MKSNEILTFGTISIRKDDKPADEHGEAYTVFAENEQVGIRSHDIDLVILAALEIKYEGINGDFASYAARMLEIDSEFWYSL